MFLRLMVLLFIAMVCCVPSTSADVILEGSGWDITKVYLDPHPRPAGQVQLNVDIYADCVCSTIVVEMGGTANLVINKPFPSRFPVIPRSTNTLAFDLTIPPNDTSGLLLRFLGCESGHSIINPYFVSEADTVVLYVGGKPGPDTMEAYFDTRYGRRVRARDMDGFHWTSHEVRGKTVEKGSILVPIQVKGSQKKLYAQLDTGCDHTPLYGPALRAFGIDFDSTSGENLAFIWCDLDDYWIDAEKERWVWVRWDLGHGVNPDSNDPFNCKVGTIGLDQIIGRVLILDFPGAQFAVVDDTALVDPIVIDTVHYVPATIEYNKFYVDVVVGEDTLKRVRFDTGSSSEHLILPKDIWQKVTGLTGDEEGIRRDSVVSWGNYVQIMTAPAKGNMEFGPITIPNPPVTYVDWPDPTMANMSLMGNAPFVDSFVVVLDCIGNRFGVSRVE